MDQRHMNDAVTLRPEELTVEGRAAHMTSWSTYLAMTHGGPRSAFTMAFRDAMAQPSK